MPVEIATTLASLDQSYPLGGDVLLQGDDHIRLLKSVLKDQFPGALGDGLASPVLATEAEFGYLVGVTSGIQGQFGALSTRVDGLEAALSAPTGTRLAFHQASPPVGWTQDTAIDDSMLRIVSGVGGGTGGTDSAILNDKVPSHSHTANVTDPGHKHLWEGVDRAMTPYGGTEHTDSYNGSEKTDSVRMDNASTGISVSVVANAGASDWTPKYHDFIVCSAD